MIVSSFRALAQPAKDENSIAKEGSALTTIIDDWLRSMDAGKPVCSVFFDVRKAFDSVPHATLVSKLQSRGLNDFC